MRQFTFFLAFSLSLFSLLSSLNASATQAPYAVLADPLAMTITQTLALPKEDRASVGHLKVLPERQNVFLMEDQAELHYTYQLQADRSAPLAFVIPGTGATSQATGGLFLAEKLYKLGYHTITVDNPFSWTFAVGGSRSGLPGYAPRDSEDLYRALQKISGQLNHDKKLRPRSYVIAGYSLGALQSLFVNRLDEATGLFKFRRVLLIDPPMDMMQAVSALDALFAEGEHLSRGRRITVFNRAAEVASQYLKENGDFSNPALLQAAFNELSFTRQDLAYLIGGSFRDSLRDVIFASQQVNDLKILKSPVSNYQRNQRYNEARSYSFQQYMTLFVYPSVRKSKGPEYRLEDLNREVSLYQFASDVQTHPNIFMIHTADDFILKDGDIAWIQENFRERAVIFPFGGHCGAMNFPQFADTLKKVFKY